MKPQSQAHWVYWAGPIAGALLAAFAYELFREPHAPTTGSGAPLA